MATRPKARPNLTADDERRLGLVADAATQIADHLEELRGRTRELVINSVGSNTTRDQAFWLAKSALANEVARDAAGRFEMDLTFARVGAPAASARDNGARRNLSSAEVAVIEPVLSAWAEAERIEADAKGKLQRLVTAERQAPQTRPGSGQMRAALKAGGLSDDAIKAAMAGSRSAGAKQRSGGARPNYAEPEQRRLREIHNLLERAVNLGTVASAQLDDEARKPIPPRWNGSAAAKGVAGVLDSEFDGASPKERAAVRRTLRVLAEQVGARDNPAGVTALALALPNPGGREAHPPWSDEMAMKTHKNPARVLAGKLAWAQKSGKEKAQALARLGRSNGGEPRDNVSRPKFEVLNAMGMAKFGSADQVFGGIPPWLTPKQRDQWLEAQAWAYRPIKPPKGYGEKKAPKPLSADEKKKRAETAKKRAESLEAAIDRMTATLEAGGLQGEALAASVAAYRSAKEGELAAYKAGVRAGTSRSQYGRSAEAHPQDATIKGYLKRIDQLLKTKKANKGKGKGGGLGLLSLQAKKKDAAAWATAQAAYNATQKTDADRATYEATLKEIAARQNPGGINGAKGWLKTAGYGFGSFVATSALAGLIDRVTGGRMSTITRFAIPAALGAATWHFGKSWSPEMRYGILGGLVAAALFKPMILGLLSRIPLIGGIFERMNAPAEPPAGTSGVGDLYDEAFGVNGYVLGDDDDDDDGMGAYVLGDDDDDDGLDGYVLGGDVNDSPYDQGTGAYVLGDDDDDDDEDGMGNFEEAVAGVVDDAPYDEEDLSGYEEAVAGFEEAVAGDEGASDIDDDLEEAEMADGMGDAEIKRQVHPAGWRALAAKFGKSVAFMRANFKVLTMTPASARNITQARRGRVIGRSKKYAGMVLVLFRMTRPQQPRGPISRGGQNVRQITARRPRDIDITRPVGGSIAPGGIFAQSVFGTNPQYTMQRPNR